MNQFTVPPGWRLWHLGQKSDGRWGAQLYNERHTKVGQGGDVFSSAGIADTPQAAIDACLKGPTSGTLFHGNSVDGDGLPLRAVEAAVDARREMTRMLREHRS